MKNADRQLTITLKIENVWAFISALIVSGILPKDVLHPLVRLATDFLRDVTRRPEKGVQRDTTANTDYTKISVLDYVDLWWQWRAHPSIQLLNVNRTVIDELFDKLSLALLTENPDDYQSLTLYLEAEKQEYVA